MENNMLDNDSSETGKVLNTIPKKELHKAPEGYFDAFPEALISHIRSASTLHSIEKKELQNAPEGYFDGFSANLMSRIQEAPVLHSLEKKEIFEQPVGYSDQLHAKVMAAVAPAKQTKIVPLSVQLFRWTAVAATLALLFTAGYYLAGNNHQVPQNAYAAETTVTDEYHQFILNETNIDDAIACYVNGNNVEQTSTENSAELDYLLEEEIDFENF